MWQHTDATHDYRTDLAVKDLVRRDAACLWHPFTQAATAWPPLPVMSAQGSYLHLRNGEKLLDAISSWWTNLHGHGHPVIAAAVAQQVMTLDHVLFAGCTHPPAVLCAESLLSAAPKNLKRVFFSDDGSTAVEVALKMAFQFHAQRGQAQRTQFVALTHGYHGDTVGAMALGDPNDFANPFGPLLFPVARVPAAVASGDALRCDISVQPQLDALHFALDQRSNRVAAVILEPMVQAAGGMILHPPAYLRGVAQLCRAYGVLLIADEVMTGFGRTGKMFACEHADLAPDLLCVAKGLTGGVMPLAATLASDEIYRAFLSDDASKAFLHGHSFTANPIACAAAIASFEIWRQGGIFEKISALTQVYADILPRLAELPVVKDVRWIGSLGVVELHDGEGYFSTTRSKEVAYQMRKRGYLLRPLGPVLYTLPPYCTTGEELTELYKNMGELLA